MHLRLGTRLHFLRAAAGKRKTLGMPKMTHSSSKQIRIVMIHGSGAPNHNCDWCECVIEQYLSCFKPYFEFVTSQGTRRIKLYVNEFSSYYPELKLCNVDVSVEFLNRNGTFSSVHLKLSGKQIILSTIVIPFTLATTRPVIFT